MDKKRIGVAAIYVLVMVPLLLLTYGANWNPSNISYDLNGETLKVKEGVSAEEIGTVNVKGEEADLLKFSLALSQENKLWKTDVTVIGLLLPFLLFALVPDRRPFREKLSFKWYLTIVLAILFLYAANSIPSHFTQINEVHQYVDQLLE